jgi:hypothetical protein
MERQDTGPSFQGSHDMLSESSDVMLPHSRRGRWGTEEKKGPADGGGGSKKSAILQDKEACRVRIASSRGFNGPFDIKIHGGAGSSESPIRLPNDSEPDGMRRETEGRAGTEERQKAGSAADEQEVEQKRLRKLERKRLKKQQDEPKEEGQEQNRNHKQDAERRARKRAKKEQKKLERERLKQEGFHPDGSKAKSRRNGERRGKNRGRRTSTADNCKGRTRS